MRVHVDVALPMWIFIWKLPGPILGFNTGRLRVLIYFLIPALQNHAEDIFQNSLIEFCSKVFMGFLSFSKQIQT